MSRSDAPRVALLVPTMNRSPFAIRLLTYYAQLGFTGQIVIGDSSMPEHVDATRQAIAALAGRLDVAYVECPGLSLAACLQRLLGHVRAPYAAGLPDDDFLVPASLDRCVSFLAEHSDYAAVHGLGISVTLDTNALRGNISTCTFYPQPVIGADTASARLDDHLSDYRVSMFSVHRVETWRTMLAKVHLQQDVPFASEILPCCHSVIAGKVKQLDCLYVIRQNHHQRYEVTTALDWITNPNWLSSYQIFLDDLSEAVAARDAMPIDAARRVVKRAFTQYLALDLGVRRRWTGAPWTLAAARRAKRLLTTLKPKAHAAFELSALLDRSSPYHADFMPIHQLLVEPRVQELARAAAGARETSA